MIVLLIYMLYHISANHHYRDTWIWL